MHNVTFALAVLSLFTTTDKAAEIEGDLLEQSLTKGRTWFWWHVKLTCIALFFHGLRQEAGKILLFSYAIYELLVKFSYWVLNPMRRAFARALDMRVSEMAWANLAIDVLFAFMVGMLLARWFPKHGGQVIFIVIGMALGRVALLMGTPEAVALALAGVVPALVGALVMKWQELRYGGWNCEKKAA